MAEFCWECTERVIGIGGEENDFVGIVQASDVKLGIFATVLCEGCGAIEVDEHGFRVRGVGEEA